MKKVSATIRPYKLDAVKLALIKVGIFGMTVKVVRVLGRSKEIIHPRGLEQSIGFIPMLELDVVMNDSQVEGVVEQIHLAAYTGEIGDGKISISPIEKVIRVRTGEMGIAAL